MADESSYYNSSLSYGVTNVSHLTAVPGMPALPHQTALSPQGGTETQIGELDNDESICMLIFMAVCYGTAVLFQLPSTPSINTPNMIANSH